MMRIVSLSLLLLTAVLYSQEYINDFASTIAVHTDGSVAITERITYVTEKNNKHGIVREIPTNYFFWGSHWSVGFNIERILKDNIPVPYTTAHASNGVIIYIGDKDIYLKPGAHTYQISYTMQRILGHHQDEDELYFNITGNGSRFPILHASAQIEFPFAIENLLHDPFGVWGYTGIGSHGKNYRTSINGNKVFIETTKPLAPKEGLTVSIAWPKGYVIEPTIATLVWYFVLDNWIAIILFIGLLAIFFIYLFAWIYRWLKKDDTSTIIPLFYPPNNCSPGGIRYVLKQQYDHVGFAADLINLAVHKCIIIDNEKSKFYFSKNYVLKKSTAKPETDEQKILMEQLFHRTDQISIKQNNVTLMERVFKAMKYHYAHMYDTFFERPAHIFKTTTIISLILVPLMILQMMRSGPGLALFIGILMFIVHYLFYQIFTGYNKQGKALIRDIEGFKLFLTTAESERLVIIGTPPEKSPELFETYLPYAVALGVEKQWRAQFASLFERLEKEHHPYVSSWWVSQPGLLFDSSFFASQLQQVVISSSSTPPIFSSGSRGGGSSGGGAGGGGTGSW